MVAQPSKKPFDFRTLLSKSGVYIFLIIGLVGTLLPFIYILAASFKPDAELRKIPPTFFPVNPSGEYYNFIFHDTSIPILRNVTNSLLVACAKMVILLFTSSFGGYLFAKYRFKGKSLAFGIILAQIMIPFQVVMIPNYLIVVKLGLIDTLWALIVPAMIDAYGIFMMKQFIEAMPNELMEAARIDGASEFSIYLNVVLPQLAPALATMSIFNFMFTWNDYLWPLIVLTSPEKRTIPLLLVWYNTQHTARQGLVLAGSMLVLAPIFLIYIFLQRWIVDQGTGSAFK
jgi:multiple sugar transport system permease protein